MPVTCHLWRTPAGRDETSRGPDGTVVFTIHDSPRAGGSYSVDSGIADRVLPYLDATAKARLTSHLIRRRRLGEMIPRIGQQEIDDARVGPGMPAHSRGMSLLEHIADRSAMLGDVVDIEKDQDVALAWAEATEVQEVGYLLHYLRKKGLIATLSDKAQPLVCLLTVDGHSALAARGEALLPDQAFVAMWFAPAMDEVYEHGIRAGIEDAGYKAFRVDRTEGVGRIDDAVIREIRRSQFVVADFTQGACGNRGSVYYEAGFAFGLNVPVIFTCRADCVDELAFDTRQYAHIVWSDAEVLRHALAQRIGAVLGDLGQRGRG